MRGEGGKSGMGGGENRQILARIAALIALLSVIPLLAAIWVVLAFNRIHRQCVPLENGLNIGYEAVFDLSGPYFRPMTVPRFADGTPVIRDDLWALYVTDTSIYGVPMSHDEPSGSFVWRADTGLILAKENPALYDRLIAEAGHANWDFGTGSIGTGIFYQELAKRPGFEARRCPTALITWKRA